MYHYIGITWVFTIWSAPGPTINVYKFEFSLELRLHVIYWIHKDKKSHTHIVFLSQWCKMRRLFRSISMIVTWSLTDPRVESADLCVLVGDLSVVGGELLEEDVSPPFTLPQLARHMLHSYSDHHPGYIVCTVLSCFQRKMLRILASKPRIWRISLQFKWSTLHTGVLT